MTLEKFTAYEAVRVSGLTNMWNAEAVVQLGEQMTGEELTEDDVVDIIKNYDTYSKEYEVDLQENCTKCGKSGTFTDSICETCTAERA